MLRLLYARMRALRDWRRKEAELDDEIAFHLSEEADERAAAGLTAEEARLAATKDFGNVTLIREDTRAVWVPVWPDQLRQDVRYALRTIRRAPGFAVIAVGSSALGIGACAVIFAIVNFALLKPLPVHEPARLMSLSESDRRTREAGSVVSYPDFRDLRQARSFDGVAAHTDLPASLGWQGDPQRHWGIVATASNSNVVPAENAKNPQAPRIRADIYAVGPDFFETMGIAFLAGEDFRLDREPVPGRAIVNDAFARAAFSNQSPIGRRVLGDGKALDIVALVATAKSRTIGEAPRPAVYLPILSAYSAADSPRGVTLVVKTRSAAAAYADPLRALLRRIDPSLAVFDVRTLEEHLGEALIVPRVAWGVSAAAGTIGLVIAVIGIYGVMSFAVVRRRKGLGIRLAIGAQRREILMMIIKQGFALALAGAATGVLAALGVTRFGATLLYGVNPVDAITFLVVPLFLVAVTLLSCMLPACVAARLDPVEVLRGE